VPSAAIVSFRLGGDDGVSIEAAKWQKAIELLGYDVVSVAGSGSADRIVPGLAMDAGAEVADAEVARALDDADVVIVENLCSLPLNPRASQAVSRTLRGRPAILHHHDLAWQRQRFAKESPPPDDERWRHVAINWMSRGELSARGIPARVVYNTFDPDPPAGRREATRAALAVGSGDLVVLQPTRAIERKRVSAAIALASQLGATFWLLGRAEEDYGPALEQELGAASCPVRTGPVLIEGAPATIHDAYAACDIVALPSAWEGFGNPALESATHRRPLLVGPYPVAKELAGFGFDWFFDTPRDRARLGEWLSAPSTELLERNAAVARRFFSVSDLPRRIDRILASMQPGSVWRRGHHAASQ